MTTPEGPDALQRQLLDFADLILGAHWGAVNRGNLAQALRDAASALAPDTFSLTRKSATYVLGRLTEHDRRDHACARCVGQENIVDWPGVAGFVCVKHQLGDWLANPPALASPPEHEKTEVIRDGSALPASTVPATASTNEKD